MTSNPVALAATYYKVCLGKDRIEQQFGMCLAAKGALHHLVDKLGMAVRSGLDQLWGLLLKCWNMKTCKSPLKMALTFNMLATSNAAARWSGE